MDLSNRKQGSKKNYSNKRDEILKNGGDLGDIIEHQANVCRELSCFGHIVTEI